MLADVDSGAIVARTRLRRAGLLVDYMGKKVRLAARLPIVQAGEFQKLLIEL